VVPTGLFQLISLRQISSVVLLAAVLDQVVFQVLQMVTLVVVVHLHF
jgi:hypothetical protein